MNRILVLCTGNTCRSPMAKGIIEAIIEENGIADVAVESRGLSAGEGDAATKNAILALEEIGIDINKHRSGPVLKRELLDADCIYVMTEHHKNVVLDVLPELETKLIVMDIPDPSGLSIDRYRECRDSMLKYFTDELLGECP